MMMENIWNKEILFQEFLVQSNANWNAKGWLEPPVREGIVILTGLQLLRPGLKTHGH
jgi:hypothetical protein